jgi:hypothetical protein
LNDSDGRVDGVAAAWSRFDSLAQRVDSRVLTTTASTPRLSRATRGRSSRDQDDATAATAVRNGLKLEKGTTHDPLSRRRFMKMA